MGRPEIVVNGPGRSAAGFFGGASVTVDFINEHYSARPSWAFSCSCSRHYALANPPGGTRTGDGDDDRGREIGRARTTSGQGARSRAGAFAAADVRAGAGRPGRV